MSIRFKLSKKKDRIPNYPPPTHVDHEPVPNASESEADAFIRKVVGPCTGKDPFTGLPCWKHDDNGNHISHTQWSTVDDYLETADPFYMHPDVAGVKIPGERSWARDKSDKNDQGVDHVYTINGDKDQENSLKFWARNWRANNPRPNSRFKERAVGNPYLRNSLMDAAGIKLPAAPKKRLRVKKQEPEVAPLKPIDTVPQFVPDRINPAGITGYAPHDAYNQPVTFVTNNPTHHCERCLPVCSNCGTRDKKSNFDESGTQHKWEMRSECNARRTSLGAGVNIRPEVGEKPEIPSSILPRKK